MRFESVLVANRGEIACRVLRTCQALGLQTVAVYSDADVGAPHVRLADRAVRLGPAPAAESYLNAAALIEAARRSGAQAIHPGYGFLAENAAFAEAVAAAGLVFIGPRPESMRAMGDKASARALMAARGVPVAPGYAGDDQSDARLIAEAERIGYPVLVKASAGGGGKGMNIVERADEMPAALAQARRLAVGAFGDATLLLERYVRSPRHIEVQIFGDEHGGAIHCFERECSVQRRFQKIIEEAPSPAVDETLRARLCEGALTAAATLRYVNAGTVEFIVSPEGDFYFLEVNTRLQVEHPVTERITGRDLVALQIDIAQGGHLPPQSAITRSGHAIEVRLYAEDPATGHLPSTGRLIEWAPPELPEVRVDAGVAEGNEIGIHYDPLLAKVIAWGETRARATQRLIGALRGFGVQGVRTNRALLIDVLRHEAWRAGALSTHFLPDHLPGWQPKIDIDAERRRAVAAALFDARQRRVARPLPGLRAGLSSALGEPLRDVWHVDGSDRSHAVGYRALHADRYEVLVDDLTWRVAVNDAAADGLTLAFGAADDPHPLRLRFTVRVDGDLRRVRDVDGASALYETPRFPVVEAAGGEGGCTAPMPGKVVGVLVAEGDAVEKGAPLVILEAMKMEQTLTAPAAAEVIAVRCALGDIVDAGAVLVVLGEPTAGT